MNPLSYCGRTLARLALLSLLLPSASGALISPVQADSRSLVVDSLKDVSANDGVTTLREALTMANADTVADIITFAPNLSGTLMLTNGQLAITNNVTIEGPTDRKIVLSGGGKSRIFSIGRTRASLSNLTLTHGFVQGSTGLRGSFQEGGPGAGLPGGDVQGGAVYNLGTLDIQNVTFTQNVACGGTGGRGTPTGPPLPYPAQAPTPGRGGIGGDGQGGAIYNLGTLTVSNSTFYANEAVAGSGGPGGLDGGREVGPAYSGPPGNSSGGALYNGTVNRGFAIGSFTLINCTFSSNSAGVGGALTVASPGTNQASNSLLVGNGGNDVKGTVTGEQNLIGGTAIAAGIQTDESGNAMLHDNGGPTPTIALVAGSPAIDGCNTSLTTDQRGFARPVGNRADIGAFEQQEGPAPTAVPTSTPTSTPTSAPTPTATPQATATSLPSATATPLPTSTPTPLPTATLTPRPTPTFTPVATSTPTPRPTATALPTSTPTPQPTATSKPRPTATAMPSPVVRVNSPTVKEGNSGRSVLVFTLTLDRASTLPVVVQVAPVPLTAKAGSDYVAVGRTALTFPPGQKSQTFTIQVIGDTLVEADEQVGLNLLSATGALIGTPRGIGTIVNDDVPIISIDSPSMREGNSGTTPLTFTLTLSQPSPKSVSVVVQSAAATNTSATAKTDYIPLTKTRVTFSPGQRRQSVSTPIVGDTIYEESERVALLLSSPSGATLITSRVEGTILNDDPLPTLSISSMNLAEGNRGWTAFTFAITLSNPSYQPVTVGYSTFSSGRGAATGGNVSQPEADYISVPSTILTFTPAQLTKVITVYVRSDTQFEMDETFLVRLAAPVNARLGASIGIGTIINDDGAAVPKQSVVENSSSGGNS